MASPSLSQPSKSAKPVESSSGNQSLSGQRGQCLRSWKEIAAYLERDPRTVQRWEKTESLPIQRHVHATGGSVYAFTADLDAWLWARTRRVTAVSPEAIGLAVATQQAQRSSKEYWQKIVLGVAIISALSALWIWHGGKNAQSLQITFEPSPLTSLVGDEVSPSFSPDGKQIAYAWGTESGRHFRVLVKSVFGPGDRQLTPDDINAFSPAWSPDGKQMAFLSASSISERPCVVSDK